MWLWSPRANSLFNKGDQPWPSTFNTNSTRATPVSSKRLLQTAFRRASRPVCGPLLPEHRVLPCSTPRTQHCLLPGRRRKSGSLSHLCSERIERCILLVYNLRHLHLCRFDFDRRRKGGCCLCLKCIKVGEGKCGLAAQ